MNELPQTRNFVQAIDKPAQLHPMTAHESAVIQQYAVSPVLQVQSALAAQVGADERTSGMDRSSALIRRALPVMGFWFLICGCFSLVIIMAKADHTVAIVMGLVAFAGLSMRSYLKMDENERYDSRNGLERYRIDTAESLALRHMDHEYKLRELALNATLKQLEGRNGRYD